MSIANTQSETVVQAGIVEDNDQVQARIEHLKELENLVGNSYPNKFVRSFVVYKIESEREENKGREIQKLEDTISRIQECREINNLIPQLSEGEKPAPEAKEEINRKLKEFGNVRIAGRLATPPRTMGKTSFVHLSDGVKRLQIYVRRDDVRGISNQFETRRRKDAEIEKNQTETDEQSPKSEIQNPKTVDGWEMFKLLDHGDFIGVEGFLFITNTGELSVHVERLQFLSKALLPMPDKMHGIADPELRRRYRYADLIADSLKIDHAENELTTREVFERRAKLISGMRRFLDDNGFIEVETPMLTPKATGAAAKPFKTHHNALDIDLYARIAPELYLKRLTVGGFEKVYELNRNFRNEGLSQRHNPEFTMLEFYCAYMDVNGMMDFCEAMIKESVLKANGCLQVKYGRSEIDFSKFERLTMIDAIVSKLPKLLKGINDSGNQGEPKHIGAWLKEKSNARFIHRVWRLIQETLPQNEKGEYFYNFDDKANLDLFEAKGLEIREEVYNVELNSAEIDKDILTLFESIVEQTLVQPTFITDYPKSISPLSKASPENPNVAERFELFIAGMECANGFSELNDPQEQFERFREQMRERETGDDEAMVLDEDYIRALAYGMPPAAGIGIGIDRLVMLLTNRHSIRDVILFPHMRPERRETEEETEKKD